MFDFEKLEVYKKSKTLYAEIRSLIINSRLDKITANQLSRATLSIALNIAEGTGRFTKRDKRNFYVTSWSSAFEVVAIFDVLKDEQISSSLEYEKLYSILAKD